MFSGDLFDLLNDLFRKHGVEQFLVCHLVCHTTREYSSVQMRLLLLVLVCCLLGPAAGDIFVLRDDYIHISAII